MGILAILKNISSARHEENIAILYAGCPPAMVKFVFPGGREQVSNIITSLAEICHVKLSASNGKMYYDLYSVFVTVFSRSVATDHPYETVANILQTQHGALIKNEETALKAIAYIEINRKDPSFVLCSPAHYEVLDFSILRIKQMIDRSKANLSVQDQYLNDPEYGLVKEKPVYTCGVRGSDQYLAGLLTADGQKLKWKRRGSVYVEELDDNIDIYDSWLLSGKPYKTVYIDMYGAKNSTKAPKGFKK